MAPEVILAGPDSITPSSPKVVSWLHSIVCTSHTQVDVWSLGVILLELVMVSHSHTHHT